MNINPNIFREYDIRGVVNVDLTPEIVEILGKSIGTYLRNQGKKELVVGRDGRNSSSAFKEALISGLLSTGCDVTDLGVVPTPVFYFANYFLKKDGGVMITGSHNPPEYNGFKIMSGLDTLWGEQILELYKIIEKGRFLEEKGANLFIYQIIPEYHKFIINNVYLKKKKLTVVVDAGNGTGGVVAVPIYRQLGCNVHELYCEVDGNFPNHHPDPTIPEFLKDIIENVKKNKADVGIAFDGDADRIGIIDDKGNILWGDQIMIILSRSILKVNPGATIIAEVKSSKLLFEEVKKLGGRPIMWKTGHSLMKKKIKDENALLGGEMSGHIFFAERYFGFDDAIYTGARILEILSNTPGSLSSFLKDLPRTYFSPEIRIPSSDDLKFKLVDEIKKEFKDYPYIDVDGIRINFEKGWALVRASNTQPVLVMRFEADTEDDLDKIQNLIEKKVHEIKIKLKDTLT